ncbi:MAG: hypothetical protein KDC34_05590 [Saprospiraceae bacterium]|nr:hypothetical protein [Saprospiraceae bacterium]
MWTKKYCLATITDLNFLGGTLVLIHSFLKHNPWYKGDIVVFTNDLEEAEVALFNRFPGCRIEPVDPELHKRTADLAAEYERFQNRMGQFYALNVFKLRGYDKVLFLDSDLLIRGSFKDLFQQKGDLLVCGDAYYYKKKLRDPITFHKVSPKEAEGLETVWTDTFNSGMMLVDKSILTDTDYQDMLNMINVAHFRKITSSHSDQMLLNQHFRGQYTLVSSTYNYRFVIARQLMDQEGIDYDACKAVHYTARKKPWVPYHAIRSMSDYPEYRKSYDEWHKDWEEVLQQIK